MSEAICHHRVDTELNSSYHTYANVSA